MENFIYLIVCWQIFGDFCEAEVAGCSQECTAMTGPSCCTIMKDFCICFSFSKPQIQFQSFMIVSIKLRCNYECSKNVR